MSIPPLSPEILVPRFGEYLVEKGLITADQLRQALELQEELREKGDVRLTGQVLIDMHVIDNTVREAVITEYILEFRSALQEANQQLLDANQQLERRVQERTAELQQALERLAELNQLKANIVANISHELRTPLTHLKGYLELLRGGDLGKLNEQQRSAVNVIDRSSERLSRLIDDLIQFSVSERDQIHVRMEPFSLLDLCKTAVEKSQSKASDKNIKISLQADKKLPNVEGDEEKISWVILQLVDNAIKFTQSGGSVTLRLDQQGSLINLSVLDTGIGIREDQIEQVFQSFYQLDGSTTRKAGGTGIGLALAKRIVDAHSSMIRVTSEVGKGSCFSFSLKMYQEKS